MDVGDEQRKLTATWLNAIGSGSIVTGFVAPTIAVTLNLSTVGPGWPLALISLAWLIIGCALHWMARRVLEALTMSVLEIYSYFILPLLVLAIGFGTLWLTGRKRHHTPAE